MQRRNLVDAGSSRGAAGNNNILHHHRLDYTGIHSEDSNVPSSAIPSSSTNDRRNIRRLLNRWQSQLPCLARSGASKIATPLLSIFTVMIIFAFWSLPSGWTLFSFASKNNSNHQVDQTRSSLQQQYTHQDMVHLVNRSKDLIMWHILIFEHEKFHLFSLNSNKDLSGHLGECQWCERFGALLVDGLQTSRPQKFGKNERKKTSKKSDQDDLWQLLLVSHSDYIHIQCLEASVGDVHNAAANNNKDTSRKLQDCSTERYPPFVTISSVPKTTSTVSPKFVYQFPTRYYNDCLFEWRLRNKRNKPSRKTAATIKTSSSLCPLKDYILQMSATNTSSAWSTMVPQIFWSGQSRTFLPERREFQQLQLCSNVLPPTRNMSMEHVAIYLMKRRHQLSPRCLAVAMTLEAESSRPILNPNPWISAKYTPPEWQESFVQRGYDFFLRNYTTHVEMSRYKYQLDLGGYGGTTWLGTIVKLAMPGLLFHHETPAMDWFYDEIQPWVHYLPVHTNLSNLYELYAWAETYPDEAQEIAQRGQDYARKHILDVRFAQTFETMYVQQLGSIADTYRSSGNSRGKDGKETMKAVLQSYGDIGLYPQLVATW